MQTASSQKFLKLFDTMMKYNEIKLYPYRIAQYLFSLFMLDSSHNWGIDACIW